MDSIWKSKKQEEINYIQAVPEKVSSFINHDKHNGQFLISLTVVFSGLI